MPKNTILQALLSFSCEMKNFLETVRLYSGAPLRAGWPLPHSPQVWHFTALWGGKHPCRPCWTPQSGGLGRLAVYQQSKVGTYYWVWGLCRINGRVRGRIGVTVRVGVPSLMLSLLYHSPRKLLLIQSYLIHLQIIASLQIILSFSYNSLLLTLLTMSLTITNVAIGCHLTFS